MGAQRWPERSEGGNADIDKALCLFLFLLWGAGGSTMVLLDLWAGSWRSAPGAGVPGGVLGELCMSITFVNNMC